MRIYDNSITPEVPKTPDFKVSTVYYQVENGHDRDGLGSEDNYFWKTAKERKENEERKPFEPVETENTTNAETINLKIEPELG
tara:strand:- start:2176 stop:2424 length:249 start_codon:yes stop_codon:yes gene_type:complete